MAVLLLIGDNEARWLPVSDDDDDEGVSDPAGVLVDDGVLAQVAD